MRTDPIPALSSPPTGRPSTSVLGALLLLRSGLALACQVLAFLGFLVAGVAEPWRTAADYWLASFAVGEVVNLAILGRLLRREGLGLRSLLLPRTSDRRGDLLWLALALAVSGPLAMAPNLLLGQALWGSAEVGADLAFRPIEPTVAAVLVVAFPLVHAATELPTYFGYLLPRLQAASGRTWLPALACALALSAQHVFLPLLPDPRFVLWRLLMFLPFALWLGFVLHRRPTVLPWLVGAHVLLDLSLPIMVLQRSLPPP